MQSRRVRSVEHVGHVREERYAYRVVVGKPEGKWPLERNKDR